MAGMDEEGIVEERVELSQPTMETKMVLRKEKGWETGHGRKKRRGLVVGGAWKLNGFREPKGQRFPGWGQRADAAEGLARKGGFLSEA